MVGKRRMTGPFRISVEGDVDSTGTYADNLRRADGRWLITEHRLTIDPSWKGEPPPRPH
jgi:hypothetical protein